MMTKRPLIIAFFLLAIGAVIFAIFALNPEDEVENEVRLQVEESDLSPILTGQVVTSAGRPVAGATVALAEETTETDREGKFSFLQIPAGDHLVSATAPGYARAGVGDLGQPNILITPAKDPENIRLILQREASLTGRIVAGQEPVDDATISLSYIFAEGLTGDQLDPFIVSDISETDLDGEFDLSSIAPGRMQVLVETAAHPFTESHEIYLRPGQKMDDLVIDLLPGGGLRGSVKTRDGEPLAASVEITSLVSGHTWVLTTRSDGFFQLNNLDEGDYLLQVEAEGFETETIDNLAVDADEMTERDIIMSSNEGIFGRVIEPDGSPVPAALVVLQRPNSAHRLQSDAEGRFTFDDIPPGQWTITATSPQHDASDTQTVRPGQEITLELTPGGTIRGRVIDTRRQPVTDYTINVAFMEMNDELRQNINQMPTRSIDDRRGVFEFGPLPSGRYRIAIQAEGFALHTTNPITVTAGRPTRPITIQLESGSTLTGTVRDRDTGEPVPGARIFSANSRGTRDRIMATTDASGEFILDGIASGLQAVNVSHPDYINENYSGINMPENGTLTYDMEISAATDDSTAFAYHGIGASLRRTDAGITVLAMPDDSPARAAGIEEGDIIMAVDQASVENLTLDQVIGEIRGEAGQPVMIDIDRPGRGIQRIEVERQRLTISRQ